MHTEAKTFGEFLEFFEAREPGARDVPMVRYQDAKLEAAVQRTSDEVDALVWERAAAKAHVHLDGKTRLRNAAAATRQFTLREWLGSHRAPAALGGEPVTVIRSVDGAGLACAPTVSKRRFSDPELQQGDDAKALLATLAAFTKPQTLKGARADAELVNHLAQAKFLAPV